MILDLDGCLGQRAALAQAIAAELRGIGLVDVATEGVRDRFLGVLMSNIRETSRSTATFVHRVERRLIAACSKTLQPIRGADASIGQLEEAGFFMVIAT